MELGEFGSSRVATFLSAALTVLRLFFSIFESEYTGLSEEMVGVGHVLKPFPKQTKPELPGDHATSTRAPAVVFFGDTSVNDILKQLQPFQQQQQQEILDLRQLLKPALPPLHLQQRSASKREAAALTPGTGLVRSGLASDDDGVAAAVQDRRRFSR